MIRPATLALAILAIAAALGTVTTAPVAASTSVAAPSPAGTPKPAATPAPSPVPPSAGKVPSSPPPAAGPIRMVPKGRRMSTYTLRARYEIGTKNVTFEAPPAYQESFAYWTGKMKGNKRMEIFEFQTITQDVREDGLIPFRRTLPRYNLEMERGGQPFAPYGPIIRDVTSLTWEGSMNAIGVIKEIRPVTTSENPEIAEIALPQLEVVFPVLDAPRDLPAGGGFTDVVTVPFPSRLNIKGLENVKLHITRVYTLTQLRGDHAVFSQEVRYTLSPTTPPEAPGTTCIVGGGGQGETMFDMRRGVFRSSTIRTVLTVDIEAPLRPLPGMEQPEGPPGTAKTRLELDILMAGDQSVLRVWGEEED